MIKRFAILIQTIVGFISCNAQNNNVVISLDDFIRNKVDSTFNKEIIPGILVGVRDAGKNRYFSAGFAKPDQKIPFDNLTMFEAGSITKTFTAYVVECVLRDHKLHDSLSILPFLPDSVRKNKALENITFLNLMNHTSGLPRLPENMILEEGNMQPYERYTSAMLFEYLETSKPSRNRSSVYSNLGMALAGVLAEMISGKTYAQLLDQYIFLPFKLVTPDNSISKSINSDGYFESQKVSYWNWDVMAPAGGLKCNAEEMLTYLSYMSKPADHAAQQIIDSLLQPTTSLSSSLKIGRGWHILLPKNKPAIYWHNGGTYGFSTFAAFAKDSDKAVVIVINKFNSNMISDKIGMSIMNKLME